MFVVDICVFILLTIYFKSIAVVERTNERKRDKWKACLLRALQQQLHLCVLPSTFFLFLLLRFRKGNFSLCRITKPKTEMLYKRLVTRNEFNAFMQRIIKKKIKRKKLREQRRNLNQHQH